MTSTKPQSRFSTNQLTDKTDFSNRLTVLRFTFLTFFFAISCGFSATSYAGEFAGSLKGVTITDAGGTNAPPTAKIDFTQNGDTINFDASGSTDSDGTIVDYRWDFGDGSTGSGVGVSHQFANGNYPVTLTVSDETNGIAISQISISYGSGVVFYWSMDTLPTTNTTSDIGNVSITKHLYDGTSSTGVTGNGLLQTGVWQTYKFPMTTLPTTKGIYSFWAKHDFSSTDKNSQYRYFFRSTNTDRANTIYAWQKDQATWFYVVDVNGITHRVFNQNDSWVAGVWYKYEFTWDATTGYISINRNGNIVAEKTEIPWAQNAPSWGTQDMFIGYSYSIGAFDEFKISQ